MREARLKHSCRKKKIAPTPPTSAAIPPCDSRAPTPRQLESTNPKFSLNMASPSPLPAGPPPADEKGDQKADRVERGQWLRAAILGANDGLLSTTSLMLGVGAAKEDRKLVVFSGVAGAFAGACSMAVGEFVSVSTQKDIEKASARRPKTTNSRDHVDPTDHHNNNLALSPVAVSPSRPNVTTIHSPRRSPMMKVIAEGDARMRMSSKKMVVDDHDNNDKGEDVAPLPNPYKAAAASASAFLCGSLVPILPAIFLAGDQVRFWTIVAVTSIALGMFGALGAYLGGSPIKISAMRVLVGGWFAMGITYWLLKPFHA